MNKFLLILASLVATFVAGLRQQFTTANGETSVGRHARAFTKLSDGAHASRHLLVKLGSDTDHVAPTGAGDRPIGVTDDQPDAAEEPINVHFLPYGGTKRLIVTAAIAEDADVYTAANGQVQALPTAAGTYYLVGTTRSASALSTDTLNYVEVETCRPVKLVISGT